ncbi:hypothetical protein QY96_00913 [Bacillus thermotolerans]|uniref:Uncharacterized protein n=1 Tax=Bacillus thermotolerans TaxID=1221996 RepID=A0A0F5I5P3_BACTR|nr:hypothetical protein QY95_01357 [Bacillus thermotolerans]KKB43208.1 hypothetical protein QY96_00913 [Bacillus thermotolerans]
MIKEFFWFNFYENRVNIKRLVFQSFNQLEERKNKQKIEKMQL